MSLRWEDHAPDDFDLNDPKNWLTADIAALVKAQAHAAATRPPREPGLAGKLWIATKWTSKQAWATGHTLVWLCRTHPKLGIPLIVWLALLAVPAMIPTAATAATLALAATGAWSVGLQPAKTTRLQGLAAITSLWAITIHLATGAMPNTTTAVDIAGSIALGSAALPIMLLPKPPVPEKTREDHMRERWEVFTRRTDGNANPLRQAEANWQTLKHGSADSWEWLIELPHTTHAATITDKHALGLEAALGARRGSVTLDPTDSPTHLRVRIKPDRSKLTPEPIDPTRTKPTDPVKIGNDSTGKCFKLQPIVDGGTRHALIVGTTGSGKSHACMVLAGDLAQTHTLWLMDGKFGTSSELTTMVARAAINSEEWSAMCDDIATLLRERAMLLQSQGRTHFDPNHMRPLTIIVDEAAIIASTLTREEQKVLLAVAQTGRSLGISIVVIGQTMKDQTLPGGADMRGIIASSGVFMLGKCDDLSGTRVSGFPPDLLSDVRTAGQAGWFAIQQAGQTHRHVVRVRPDIPKTIPRLELDALTQAMLDKPKPAEKNPLPPQHTPPPTGPVFVPVNQPEPKPEPTPVVDVRSLDTEGKLQVILKAQEAGHTSLRDLEKHTGLSKSTIGRLLKKAEPART